MLLTVIALFNLLVLPILVSGQLSGKVGPTTTLAQKRAKKTCSITEHGARPGKGGDIGPALAQAFNACKSGGNIVIPAGDWGLATWVNFNGGSGWSLQWDGTIHRSGRAGGNMLLVQHANDVEFWSSNGKGAFQGSGYEYHLQGDIKGPRILRFVKTSNFAVHDLSFADAPSFHFSMDTCKNGEVYNMAIRGAYQGGLDGIDVWSDNMWIHDIMVTNKDECVTVKSPAHHILVENIYCNWSGGSAFGSLGVDVDISNVIYRNVYTVHSNQMMMIKSNGGSGHMENVVMENFIGYSNAYTLDIDQHWSPMKPNGGAGVKLNNITFKNWKGTCEDGNNRPPIKIICSDTAPCHNIRVQDFAVGSDRGSSVTYQCQSAYGSGGCLKSGSGGSYPSVKTTHSSPQVKGERMPWDLRENPGTKRPIQIPAIPDHFFPGTKPIKPLARSNKASRLDAEMYDLFNATLVQRQAADPPLTNPPSKPSPSGVMASNLTPKPFNGGKGPGTRGTGPPPPRWRRMMWRRWVTVV